MPSQAMKYKILIASPSDVVEERKIIPEVIEYWNTVNSDHYGVILKPVLWEIDATPKMGKSPQDIINKQLVRSCDILVGTFWTRLGTHTGKAESGTVEEIEEFLKDEKPVLLYFSSIPVVPENINIEQCKRLSEFKKKCEKEGLVTSYKSIDELQKKLQMHITKTINDISKEPIDVSEKLEKVLENESKKYEKYLQTTGMVTAKSLPAAVSSGRGLSTNITATEAINSRIYDESKLPPLGSAQLSSYKWSAQNFEGFWYDLKTGATSEILEIGGPRGNALNSTIYHNNRTIPERALVYQTIKQRVRYKVNETNLSGTIECAYNEYGTKLSAGAGYYYKLGWFGEPYIAVNGKAKKISKLILEQDSTDTVSLKIGETWNMGDGYSLTAESIDANSFPRQVWLVLSKDGVKLDDKVAAQGEVYTYVEQNIAGELNVPLFVTYIDNVYAGETSDIVQLKYSWLISSSVVEIKCCNNFGVMEVVDSGDTSLLLQNKKPINLSKKIVDIMGGLKFKIADDPNFLRFYPFVLRDTEK